MAVEFPMPKLGLTMEEATIVAWLVPDGSEVDRGTVILQIETDKVESDVEASGSGVLHITGAVGETYECGDRIGWFLEPGEPPPAERAAAPPRPASRRAAPAGRASPPSVTSARAEDGRLLASPNARRVAAERGIDLSLVAGSGPGGRIVSEDVPATPPSGPLVSGGAARGVTAAARRLADSLGVDLGAVPAHGPDPRIDRADVARYARERLRGDAPPTPTTDTPLLQVPSELRPMTGMRGRIAERMHASLREMAQLTLTMEVVMDAVLRDRAEGGHETKPGYTDYVVAAVASALREHPVVNSQISGGQLALLPEINVGVAIAVDGGLVVPVVPRTDTLSIEGLSAETTRLAAAARSGGLSLTDLEGGTFSVTALGMYGVDAFTPVVNPPNTAILGVGRLRDGVRWNGSVAENTTVLTLSLTWDHRAFDGAPAAEFTADVRDRLERWGSPP